MGESMKGFTLIEFMIITAIIAILIAIAYPAISNMDCSRKENNQMIIPD